MPYDLSFIVSKYLKILKTYIIKLQKHLMYARKV